MYNSTKAGIFSVLLIALTSPASADLESSMTAMVVKTAPGGTEQFQPASQVKPGETIEYRIVHVNSFDHALDGVAVLGPIPSEMELVAVGRSTDVPAVVEVQGEFDPDTPGEEWSTLPATKIVVSDDGTRTTRPAGRADFTAVRWRLTAPLPQHGTVRHVYRAKVR